MMRVATTRKQKGVQSLLSCKNIQQQQQQQLQSSIRSIYNHYNHYHQQQQPIHCGGTTTIVTTVFHPYRTATTTGCYDTAVVAPLPIQPNVQKRFMIRNSLTTPPNRNNWTTTLHQRSISSSIQQQSSSSQQQRYFSSNNQNSLDDHQLYKNDAKTIKEDHAYCVNLVKDRDGEGYLCGLLMPSSIQKSYFALRAYNVEIASIKDGHNIRRKEPLTDFNNHHAQQINTSHTQSTVALQLRMSWWRNAIEQIYIHSIPAPVSPPPTDNDTNHIKTKTHLDPKEKNYLALATSCWNNPIVRSLHRANLQLIQQHKQSSSSSSSNTTSSSSTSSTGMYNDILLTRRFLDRLIDTREKDLFISQYDTMEQLINYCEETMSSLLYSSLEIAGIRNDEADVVAYYAGIGIGLTLALRSTPFRLLYGEIPIPNELFYNQVTQNTKFPFEQLLYNDYYGNIHDENKPQNITLSETDALIFYDATKYLANVAIQHLSQARVLQKQIPKDGKPNILLPMIPALHYLNKLHHVDYNVFHPNVTNHSSQRIKLLFLLSRTWLSNTL